MAAKMRINGINIKVAGAYFHAPELPYREILLIGGFTQIGSGPKHLRNNERRTLRHVSAKTLQALERYGEARGRFMMSGLYLGQRYSMAGRPEIAPLQIRHQGNRQAMKKAAEDISFEFVGEGVAEYHLAASSTYSRREYVDKW